MTFTHCRGCGLPLVLVGEKEDGVCAGIDACTGRFEAWCQQHGVAGMTALRGEGLVAIWGFDFVSRPELQVHFDAWTEAGMP